MTLEYRVGKRVAKGGFGTVYRGTLSDGKPVAVKRLRAGRDDDGLIHEAHVLASLEHPNIVQFHGVQKRKRDKLDLVMEWVGPSLERLMRSGHVCSGSAVHIICEILTALDYLHSQGKVHRDLSPRNILLGDDGSVKLADFGLAKREGAPRTTTGVKGSPPYMSPEQLSGAVLDGRSDLFAVGVLFYQLLAGRLPFGASHIEKRLPLPPVTSQRPGIPAELGRIVSRLLEYHRARRFPSARAALAALPRAGDLEREAGRADLVILLRERGLLASNTMGKARVGMLLAALVAAGALLGAGATFLLRHPEPEPGPPRVTPRATRAPVEEPARGDRAASTSAPAKPVAARAAPALEPTKKPRDKRARKSAKPRPEPAAKPTTQPGIAAQREGKDIAGKPSGRTEYGVGKGKMVIYDPPGKAVFLDETAPSAVTEGKQP